jgi:hypothetical protein
VGGWVVASVVATSQLLLQLQLVVVASIIVGCSSRVTRYIVVGTRTSKQKSDSKKFSWKQHGRQ